jgi:hypothetical protein
LVLLIIAYTLSSTKLDIRTKQFLPGSEVGRGTGWGKGVEMTQTLYVHMNKRKKKYNFKEKKLANSHSYV